MAVPGCTRRTRAALQSALLSCIDAQFLQFARIPCPARADMFSLQLDRPPPAGNRPFLPPARIRPAPHSENPAAAFVRAAAVRGDLCETSLRKSPHRLPEIPAHYAVVWLDNFAGRASLARASRTPATESPPANLKISRTPPHPRPKTPKSPPQAAGNCPQTRSPAIRAARNRVPSLHDASTPHNQASVPGNAVPDGPPAGIPAWRRDKSPAHTAQSRRDGNPPQYIRNQCPRAGRYTIPSITRALIPTPRTSVIPVSWLGYPRAE